MPHRARPTVLAVGLVLLAVMGVVMALVPPAPARAQAATGVTPAAFFGMHDTSAGRGAWPDAPIGSVRIWDNGVTWRDLAPTAHGPYRTALLDTLVGAAVRRHLDPVLVLGGTPAWASARVTGGAEPATAGFLGLGAADPPRAAAWAAYVTAMVTRYRTRGVHVYEVWNEPNVLRFWNGSPAQMAALTRTTTSIVRRLDRTAVVLSPSFVLRLPTQQRWFTAYARTGALTSVDAVSLHLYPMANQGPESSIALLAAGRRIMREVRVAKPVFNSEVNYGLQGGSDQAPRTVGGALGAAYVARTYLLNRAAGVSRVYWYGWSHMSYIGVNLQGGTGRDTAATAGLRTVTRWLRGQRIDSCPRDASGTYRCTITTARTKGYVYWNPTSRRPVVRTPTRAYQLEYVGGTSKRVGAGARVRIGKAPILVRVHR